MATPLAQRLEGGINLGYHPTFDHTLLLELLNLGRGQRGDERVFVAGIAPHAVHIRKVNDLVRLERLGDFRRRDIRVDIIGLSIGANRPMAK